MAQHSVSPLPKSKWRIRVTDPDSAPCFSTPQERREDKGGQNIREGKTEYRRREKRISVKRRENIREKKRE